MTFVISIRHGVAWFRFASGRGLALHAPWDQPLFSERNGYRKTYGAFGWRIEVLPVRYWTPNGLAGIAHID